MSAPDVYLFRFIGETIENAIAHFVTPTIRRPPAFSSGAI